MSSKSLPTKPTEYPTGTFVETEKGYFFIVAYNKRYRLLTQRVLDSWRPLRVVRTTEAALSNYRIAAKMRFRNGSLLWSLGDANIYLVVDGKRCPLTSPEAFERIGAVVDDAVGVSKDELNLHELGAEIA